MKMMMRMTKAMPQWLLFVGLAVMYTAAAAGPGSCVGRCGEVFTRGQQCTCDLSCVQHNECCQDFQALCTNIQSCQGRCGEAFRRGQSCDCDPQCVLYNTCCPDFQLRCDASAMVMQSRTFHPQRAAASGKRKSFKNKKRSSESEEWYTAKRSCPQYPGGQCPSTLGPINPGPINPLPGSPNGPAPPAVPINQLQQGGSNIPAGLLPISGAGSSLPSNRAPSQGTSASAAPSGPGAAGGNVNVHVLVSPGGVSPSGGASPSGGLSPSGGVSPSGPSQGLSGPAGSRPSTLQDVVQALGVSGSDGPGAGFLADVNLCSDSPINGLTALSNGTILIFKGELFWSVDPASRSVGLPQSLTDTLGVPSPIDTVFTRCNCHGNTYIIKGDQVWRLDGNMVMEPGYPKPLSSEFPGLTGDISAALAIPATRSRPETVYFFKNGDIMQSLTFPSGNTPPCSEAARTFSQSRFARQAPEVLLSGEINIKLSLKGFPTPVTSALSMPTTQRSDQYEHYVFSGPLYFRVQISGDLPALAKPDPPTAFAPLPILSPVAAAAANTANMAAQGANPPQPPPANSITVWLRCP